jgi:hypothetical protein
MAMKLKPYSDIIKMAKEKIDELKAPIRAAQMRKKAEGEQLDIEQKIMDLDVKIDELAGEYPINFDKLIEVIDSRALLERRKEQFGKIIKEMFPA